MDERSQTVANWLAVGFGLCILGMGIGAGLNIAFQVGVTSAVATAILTWLLVTAVGLGLLLLALFALSLALDAGEKRIRDPSASYAPFIGVVAGLLIGLISKILEDDAFFAVAIGLAVGFVSALAASLIRARPWIGLGLYSLVALAIAILIVLTTSPSEFEQWIDDRTVREWVLVAFTSLIAIGIPASVALIERLRHQTSG